MDTKQFVHYIVRPTLEYLAPEVTFSFAAAELVAGTAFQESRLEYVRQLGDGPALGLWQCEPATHDDVWDNYLQWQPPLAAKVRGMASQHWWQTDRHRELSRNLAYACAICRVHYRRVKEPLPPQGDVYAQAVYWKRYYNTEKGRGKVSEYVENWHRAMGEDSR